MSSGSDTNLRRHESSSRTERKTLLEGEKAEEPVSLFGRFRQVVAGLFGAGGTAEAKTGAAAAESGEAKYNYNQVRLIGEAQHFAEAGMQKKLGAWIASQEEKLGDPIGKSNTLPIEFAGGQRIEVSGNDIVMKGFHRGLIMILVKKCLKMESHPSAYPPRIEPPMQLLREQSERIKILKQFLSRFTSVSLFFQRAVQAMASFWVLSKKRPQSPVTLKTTGTSTIMS